MLAKQQLGTTQMFYTYSGLRFTEFCGAFRVSLK